MDVFFEVFVLAAILYGIIGLLFAYAFVVFGLEESDPAAKGTTMFFKLIIIPGLAVFWPLFAIRWIIGVKEPPQERNAHRIAAKTYQTRPH